MGSKFFHFFNPFRIPISQIYSRRFANDNCRYSNQTDWSRLSGGLRWEWRAYANPSKRSRFRDAYVTEDFDEDDRFGFRNATTQRIWWLDDSYEDDEFGFVQGSVGINWVVKVFQAFGWMIPAIIISLLLGTGPNAIIPALALPLAQSAFSLVADAIWGGSAEVPRQKSRSKKRPFARATSNSRAKKKKANSTQSRKGSGDYKSWVVASNVSAKNETSNSQNFGGWDELDSEVRVDETPDAMPVRKVNEPRVEERVRVSTRVKGDTPLLLRLLIATFPVLGFWTKLL